MSIPTDPKTSATAIIIGGLTDFTSLDDASKWLGTILWEGYAPQPIATYIKRKDAEFDGLFCANFSSPEDRAKNLNILKAKIVELGNKEIWANVDLPASVRAPDSFLFALEKQLVAWDFAKGSVFVVVDGPSKILKVEGKTVLTIACADGHLNCEWEEEWKNWDELQKSAELKLLLEHGKKILTSGGKGKSKGKPH